MMKDGVNVFSKLREQFMEKIENGLPEGTKYIDINGNEGVVIKNNYIERAGNYDEKVIFIDCLVNGEVVTYCNDKEVSSDSYDCDGSEKFYNICIKIIG